MLIAGCTQQTPAAPVTTVATTAAPTEEITPAETPEETVAETAMETPAEEMTPEETVVEETTPEETTVVPETTEIVTASMTPSTTITVIHIVNNTFTPATLMILPGTRISWVNDDTNIHSVKAVGTYKGKFNSGDIAPTARWGYDFGETEGSFEFADGYNQNVTGVIIVKKGDSLIGKVVSSTPYVTSTANW
jgi:plastocyanin